MRVLWYFRESHFLKWLRFFHTHSFDRVLFGLTGPCFISLVTPVAVTLYGTHNLATLTGLLNISNMPGMRYINLSSYHRLCDSILGSLSGPPIGGVILESSGRNWHALTAYSGVIQFVGVLCMLYGKTFGPLS
jgi:hypothetical protein